MAKVLLVDDDEDLVLNIEQRLIADNFMVEVAYDGKEALERLDLYTYDVIILDWNLPHLDGIDVCRTFRSRGGTTPILMFTGKSEIDSKEAGLDSGADDYLTKPFDPRELTARLRALLRRPAQIVVKTVTIRNLTLNIQSHSLYRDGVAVPLSPREFALLEFFFKHPNQMFSTDALIQRVWHADANVGPDTVRTHVKNLRNKLDTEGQPSLLVTAHRIGYKLDVPELLP